MDDLKKMDDYPVHTTVYHTTNLPTLLFKSSFMLNGQCRIQVRLLSNSDDLSLLFCLYPSSMGPCLVLIENKQREEKVKDVAAVQGTEFIQFREALQNQHQEDWKEKDENKNGDSHHTKPPPSRNGCSFKNFSSNHPIPSWGQFKYVPKTASTTFAFSSICFFFYACPSSDVQYFLLDVAAVLLSVLLLVSLILYYLVRSVCRLCCCRRNNKPKTDQLPSHKHAHLLSTIAQSTIFYLLNFEKYFFKYDIFSQVFRDFFVRVFQVMDLKKTPRNPIQKTTGQYLFVFQSNKNLNIFIYFFINLQQK